MASEDIRCIAVNTGGGDAPGLNAVIRAVTITAMHHGWRCVGIREGYNGLRVPFGDTQALARALARTLTSDDLNRTLSVGAVENAKRYTAGALTARLSEVVERAVGSRAPEFAVASS